MDPDALTTAAPELAHKTGNMDQYPESKIALDRMEEVGVEVDEVVGEVVGEAAGGGVGGGVGEVVGEAAGEVVDAFVAVVERDLVQVLAEERQMWGANHQQEVVQTYLGSQDSYGYIPFYQLSSPE